MADVLPPLRDRVYGALKYLKGLAEGEAALAELYVATETRRPHFIGLVQGDIIDAFNAFRVPLVNQFGNVVIEEEVRVLILELVDVVLNES